jgi:hypothetical protein
MARETQGQLKPKSKPKPSANATTRECHEPRAFQRGETRREFRLQSNIGVRTTRGWAAYFGEFRVVKSNLI